MDVKIENKGHYLYIKIIGVLQKDDAAQFEKARGIAGDAIAFANQTGINKVLCDAKNVYGSISPTARLSFSLFLAKENIGRLITRNKVVKVAFLAKPELIDPGRIGATILRNRGMNVLVTSDRQEAVKWLGIQAAVN